MKSEKEIIKGYMEEYDFLDDEFIEEIDRVYIFCEDCEECSLRDECPSVDTLGVTGMILKKLHKTYEEIDVDSRLHALTSEDNGELDEIVHEAGCVMPVKAMVFERGCVCGPMRNFLLFKMVDGRQLLYDVNLEDTGDGDDVNWMMYG